jgi:SAM-dependent methyltransferase
MTESHVGPASTDLLAQDAVRDTVRERYRGVIGRETDLAHDLYTAEELALAPAAAIAAALGVGDPIRRAQLRSGETVLDLGCGSGIDTIIAARQVTPGGRAIGLDTLPDMLARAAANARTAGVENVTLVRGELERIPLADGVVDVAISNGVFNLSPRKARALQETFRVVRSGGRISIADIVLDEELPAEVMTDPDAWAG